MSRRIVLAEPGALRIEQRTRVARTQIATDISGPACIYAHVRVTRGRIAYLHADTRLVAPACFAVFLPPFSVVQAWLEHCDVTSIGMAFLPPALALPAEAVLVPDTRVTPPATRDDALEQLQSLTRSIPIRREGEPRFAVRQAKGILDREYASPVTIAETARRVGTSPALLSRTFKTAYGIPPVQYRHHVRIIDALMRFAAGAVPADVSLDVGFEDLSRFYKVFRRVACGAPGSYRPVRSRNAKT